jgi:uncharacterized protein YjiS (DUF1127 family)
MASHVIDTTRTSTHGSTSVWTETKQRFSAWRRQRATRARITRELATYTDRELFDLGITRADIPAVINGTYRR